MAKRRKDDEQEYESIEYTEAATEPEPGDPPVPDDTQAPVDPEAEATGIQTYCVEQESLAIRGEVFAKGEHVEMEVEEARRLAAGGIQLSYVGPPETETPPETEPPPEDGGGEEQSKRRSRY